MTTSQKFPSYHRVLKLIQNPNQLEAREAELLKTVQQRKSATGNILNYFNVSSQAPAKKGKKKTAAKKKKGFLD